MSRKQCKRRHYPLINSLTMAMEGAAITPDGALDKLRLLELSQIEALATGRATLGDLRNLTDMLNLCETMAKMGIGPEALPACAACEASILAIKRRFERWHKLEVTPDEMETIREVFRFHDLQRQSVPRSKYECAIKRTRDLIRSAHPSCVVLV